MARLRKEGVKSLNYSLRRLKDSASVKIQFQRNPQDCSSVEPKPGYLAEYLNTDGRSALEE